MRTSRHRNLFLALLAGGALVGVVAPWLADHSLRLAGITLPAGIIAGMIIYVTIDVLASPAPGKTSSEALTDSAPLPDARRQLMILAILAAIVAHFIEIHFGIAIAATRTHFWILAAMLVAMGKGWIRETDEAPVPVPATQAALPASSGSRKKPKGKRTESRTETARAAAMQQPRALRLWVSYLPYAAIGAIISLVLTWDYLVNQTGADTAFAVLWNAFTKRVDNTSYQIVESPMLLFLVLFTWLLGLMISLSEHKVQQAGNGRYPWMANASLFLGASVVIFLGYGLIQAARLLRRDLAGIEFFRFLAGHIAFFDVVLLLLGLTLAAALWFADRRPRPQPRFHAPAALSIGAGAIATLLAFLVIVNVNIETVQADTYYKQGSSYEAAESWQSAVIMYREAAELEPQEDNYYLYLGRGLLQYATTLSTSDTPLLPADLSAVPTEQLLDLVDRGLRANNREDVMRASYAALTAAQRLNPYNTDHSSNLARLDRSWAFADALTASDVPTNTRLREIVQTQPDAVHLDRLQQALDYYGQATSLSPHNAQLWNELAAVQFISGDSAAAFASLDRSQQLDPLYAQTYVIRGDLLAADDDKANAVAAYEEAARLQPKNIEILSAVGVYNAQLGNTEPALEAFDKTVEIEDGVLATAETNLAVLEAQANAAGGFTMLTSAATNRRNQLQSGIAQARSQLYLTYRNKALVLLEANRLAEALEAAQASLSMATQDQSATVQQLIADIQGRLSQ